MEFIIYSGGQTGVDRAALDTAIKLDIEYSGYIPKGGLAEDHKNDNFLLHEYDNLIETKTRSYPHRTKKNIEETDCTLILNPLNKLTRGTQLTKYFAEKSNKPFMVSNLKDSKKVVDWITENYLETNSLPLKINIAGPRESNSTEISIYEESMKFLEKVFKILQKETR